MKLFQLFLILLLIGCSGAKDAKPPVNQQNNNGTTAKEASPEEADQTYRKDILKKEKQVRKIREQQQKTRNFTLLIC